MTESIITTKSTCDRLSDAQERAIAVPTAQAGAHNPRSSRRPLGGEDEKAVDLFEPTQRVMGWYEATCYRLTDGPRELQGRVATPYVAIP